MIFIKFSSIKNEKTIDVRSKTEFKNMNLFEYNLPIIDEAQHKKIKKFYPCAFFIIIKSLYKKKELFKSELLRISDNGRIPIVIGCSRGRLRSPIACMYAKWIGIKNCKILLGGIKPIFTKKKDSH